MKLRQLLKAHFDTNGPTPMGRGILDYNLNSKLLEVYHEELSKCVEFNGSQIIILSEIKPGKPKRILTGHDEDGIPKYNMTLSTLSLDDEPIVTLKLNEIAKFAPVVKIYSISLGPEMFDPQDVFKSKLDTVCITPSVYDTESLKPMKRIVITYSPEIAQDSAIKELKKEIREKEKDEDKPEFIVKTEKYQSTEEKDAIIKKEEENAHTLMENIHQDDIKQKVREKEEDYLQKLIGLLEDSFRNPMNYQLPSKRSILIRLTQNSLVDNTTPIINPADLTVTLNTT
jgi:hypothetical protein